MVKRSIIRNRYGDCLAYKVLVSRVTSDNTVPPIEEEEQVPISTSVVSSKHTCNKCKMPEVSKIQLNPDLTYCVCGGLLAPVPIITQVINQTCALLSPPKTTGVTSVVADIHNIRVGSTVCRKVKMHQFGVVENITYAWGTVKYITQVWVKWHGKPIATPYALIDLLVITVH